MLKKDLIYGSIIIFVIIVFLQFFSFKLISEDSVFKYPSILAISLILFIAFLLSLRKVKEYKYHPIDKLIILFILSMILSSTMAFTYWDQSFSSSLSLYRDFYIYFLYFSLILLNIPLRIIEQIIVLFFFATLLVFLLDYITFPDPLFAWRHEERRSGITIFFYGQGFTFLGAFYLLNNYFEDKKVKNLIWFLLSCLCLFVLTQSRMNLIALVCGFFLLLYNSDFKKKFFVTVLAVLLGVGIYFSTDAFNGIREESEIQAESYQEDVRILAHKYFITELQRGIPTIIFGNGIPGKNSTLDKESIKGSSNGFFVSDVGITGIYSYFGLLGAITWLLLFYYIFKLKTISRFNYLKAYFLTLLTTVLSGYSIFEPGYMPATMLALYLVRYQSSIFYIIESPGNL